MMLRIYGLHLALVLAVTCVLSLNPSASPAQGKAQGSMKPGISCSTPWINEGLAEWVGNLVVPQCTAVPRRQRDAIARVQASGTMEGMFNIDANTASIETWQYGLASSLAQFLIQTNPQAYGGLFTLIKEGATWQEALKELYGVTPAELAAEYGRSIGIADLRP